MQIFKQFFCECISDDKKKKLEPNEKNYLRVAKEFLVGQTLDITEEFKGKNMKMQIAKYLGYFAN